MRTNPLRRAADYAQRQREDQLIRDHARIGAALYTCDEACERSRALGATIRTTQVAMRTAEAILRTDDDYGADRAAALLAGFTTRAEADRLARLAALEALAS